MTVYALRLENGTDTAARMRLGDLLALPAGSAPLTSRSALRADGGGVVAVVAGSMNVTVAPFIAWVQGGVSVLQGGYPLVCDASVTVTLAAGHATLARVDTIAAVVRENAFDGSAQTAATVEVVQGTPGAGAPALPVNCVPLRDVNVPAGLSAGTGGLAASNLGTDRRKYLGAAPHLRAGFNAGQSQAANTTIAFPAIEDTESGYSAGAYTVKRAGVYRVTAQFQYGPDGNPSSENVLALVNGTTVLSLYANGATGAAYATVGGTGDLRCQVGDVITIRVTSPFATAPAAFVNNFLNIDWLRP